MTKSETTPIDLEDLDGTAAPRLWIRPVGCLAGAAAARAVAEGSALPLAGGPTAFALVEVLAPRADGTIGTTLVALPRLHAWVRSRKPAVAARVEAQLSSLGAMRAPWAGFALDRPLVMGIVNVTPDSFSENGAFADPSDAIAHGRALLAAGADILDIGGESTRPGASPVAPEEEIRRVAPVIRALAEAGAVVSVDTRHAAVMAASLAAGARIVNDVSALAGEPDSLAVVARAGAPAVLMHMQGEPAAMQLAPSYRLASLDIVEALAERIAACEAAGIPRDRLIVDPGIGFGKRPQHNLEILARLSLFHALGCGVLLGVSRKSLVGRLTGAAPRDRLPGSLAGALHAVSQGVQILRVHDVAETRQAITVWQAIQDGA